MKPVFGSERSFWGLLIVLVGLAFLVAIPSRVPAGLPSPSPPADGGNGDADHRPVLPPSVPAPAPTMHVLSWLDGEQEHHSGRVIVAESSYKKARHNRHHVGKHPQTGESFRTLKERLPALFQNDYYSFHWLWVYRNLVRHDETFDDLFSFSESLGQSYRSKPVEFADHLVAAVQHVPYALIHEDTCEVDVERDPGYSKRYHANDFNNGHANNQPCVPEVRFAIHSPLEFFYTLQGDCDTRVVLLFTLLKHHGYDVAILCSKAYNHCVLGISLPSPGRYFKVHRGKKYYTWETTRPRYRRGALHSGHRNMDQWKVLLTS